MARTAGGVPSLASARMSPAFRFQSVMASARASGIQLMKSEARAKATARWLMVGMFGVLSCLALGEETVFGGVVHAGFLAHGLGAAAVGGCCAAHGVHALDAGHGAEGARGTGVARGEQQPRDVALVGRVGFRLHRGV